MAAKVKRFYETVATVEGEDGWSILLDGRPVCGPGKAVLRLTTTALAEAVAEEWRAQGETIEPASMPLLRLANTAQELVAPNPAPVVEETADYARTDLLCYRAGHPAELAARQAAHWQPLLDWVLEKFDAALLVTTSLTYVEQPADAVAALRRAVAELDAPALTAVHAATQATGSLVLALALAHARVDAEAAFAASQLDESYQIEVWGEDHEATHRRAHLLAEIADIARFMACLRGETPVASVRPA